MFTYALNLVMRRKLRTFLTSLGITISVVLLSFIIFGMQGLSDALKGEFTSRFSPNQLMVSAQDFNFNAFGGDPAEEDLGDPVPLTPAVIAEIESQDFVEKVDPFVILLNLEISLDGSSKKGFAPAFGGGYEEVKGTNFFLEVFSEKDEPGDGEIFIGINVAEYFELLPDEIIGQTVTLKPSTSSIFNQKSADAIGKEYTYLIAGVVDPGIDRADVVLTLEEATRIAADLGGFETSEEYIDTFGYDQLVITATEGEVEIAKEFIKDNYNIIALTSEDLVEFLDQITAILGIGLFAFGAISSLVASIGIINTMVMSIYEQTREIGIIKAIGASNRQVLTVFLIQSGLIGFFGSIIGLSFVGIIMLITDPVIVDILQEEGLTLTRFYSFDFVIAAIITLISIGIGILAGLYPAFKAARIDPVKALRYE